MIDNRRLLIAAALACLVLTGCQRKAAEGNKAAGEVLEGTISDSMIATDEVRSEAPIAPRASGSPDAKSGKAKPKAGDAVVTAESPTPEASPTMEASPAPKPATSEPAG